MQIELIQMDTDVVFYHESDERAFFEWLSRIPCVGSYIGEGRRGLVVRLKHRPEEPDLRQILAICYRYGVNMRQLAQFETPENRHWFCDPKTYWHASVFGSSSPATPAG